jgi:hypothetical protein
MNGQPYLHVFHSCHAQAIRMPVRKIIHNPPSYNGLACFRVCTGTLQGVSAFEGAPMATHPKLNKERELHRCEEARSCEYFDMSLAARQTGGFGHASRVRKV